MLIFYMALIDEPNDKQKFKDICTKYRKMMFHVAMGILHNRALAEEAVQDSLLKIARNISKISEPVCGKTANFIVIIVRNTSISNLKNEHLEDNVPFNDNAGNYAIPMPDFERALSEKGYESILEMIDEMESKYGDILKMKYIYGYDNSEISEMLGISAKNVATRLYRGKEILKKKLEDSGYGTE